jgi:uroporphyrin-III C-methyltransferase
VQWAGTSREKRVCAPLGDIAARAAAQQIASPAVILIGGAIGEAIVELATRGEPLCRLSA